MYINGDLDVEGTITAGGGLSSLEVKEIDGAPDVTGVSIIRVTNGTLTDDGGGQVTLSIGGGSNHDLLDGAVNQDTVAQAVTRGSLIVGNATPKWDELVIGSANTLLKSDGTDAAWGTVNLLSGFHGDTVAQTPSRGSLIYGNATPKWDEKVIGSANSVLWSDGTDLSWNVKPRVDTIYYEGRIIPTNISAQADNYNPVDSGSSQSFHDVMHISMAATGAQTITGLDVGTTGEPKVLTNRGTSTITLAHASGSSSVNNQFWCPNATNYSLQQKASVFLYYSQPDNKWVVVDSAASSGGSNALLDGSVHSDTVAQTVSRGSLIYGNSTPAWDELTIGSAGKVLTSDGTDVSWQTLSSSGGLQVGEVNLTDAQIKSLNTSPVNAITAPGANKLVIPISMTITKDSTAGAYSASPSVRLRWTGSTTDLLDSTVWTLTGTNQTFQRIVSTGAIAALAFTTFDPRNKTIQISTSADVTGGNAANSAKVSISYFVSNTI